MNVPGVGAFFFEEVDDAVVDGVVVERFVALLAEEDSDGDAPDALAGDAPVRARGDHVGDALLAPGWIPVTFAISSRARWRKVVSVPFSANIGVSMPMNHCSVARTMIGLWQRQQWG